jgi:hypothetical protein
VPINLHSFVSVHKISTIFSCNLFIGGSKSSRIVLYFSLHCRPLSQIIQGIVGQISRHLSYEFSEVTEGLVGIYSRVVELESCLAVGVNDVRFIGIWAMGGMGKTTLARVVYRMVSQEFEACSFIGDVRDVSEKDGLLPLQQKLILEILKETNLNIEDTS